MLYLPWVLIASDIIYMLGIFRPRFGALVVMAQRTQLYQVLDTHNTCQFIVGFWFFMHLLMIKKKKLLDLSFKETQSNIR